MYPSAIEIILTIVSRLLLSLYFLLSITSQIISFVFIHGESLWVYRKI